MASTGLGILHHLHPVDGLAEGGAVDVLDDDSHCGAQPRLRREHLRELVEGRFRDAAPVLGQHRQDEPVVELPVQHSVQGDHPRPDPEGV